MPFQKGQSGNLSGRPKGSENKDRFDVAKILREQGHDPFLELIKLAKTTDNEHIILKVNLGLAPFVAAQLKSVELKSDSENPFSITLNLGGSK